MLPGQADGMFGPVDAGARFLTPGSQTGDLAYSGHITPVLRDGCIVTLLWTVLQTGKRNDLRGHSALALPSPALF